ncbi:molybdopterin molybdotransferase MoeA [Agrilactobacillus yilanensis]|uniref:Molybdopterin molybdenumtransferase n=1 Tax=Agrilactobacillus yilanensis TaxID=2485997 RepID=A0ABW4J8C7_9LACO|nr:molybdopterin molybdotransferase MoeA [Agrilactobacillus yilanensis]
MLDQRTAITIDEAKAKIDAIPLSYHTETISVLNANQRVLAETFKVPYDFPNFRRSKYDGYAIRAEDDHDFPKNFKVMSEVPAGAVYDQPLGENETVRIMTGAAVPDNTGKVIMLEQSRPVADAKDQIQLTETAKGSNIVEIGVEYHKDAPLIEAGTVLNPGYLSLLSAFGITEIAVYATPKVGIISTGTEVLAPGQPLEPGKIYNSNGALLAGLVVESGGEVVATRQIVDDYQLLLDQLDELVASCDLILTTGGVSVGDYDFLAMAAKASQKLIFNKLKMRPGSVTTAFIYKDTPILALSGNPGACFTGFYLYTEPLLRRLAHDTSHVTHSTGIIEKPYHVTNSYDRILRGTYRVADGKTYVQLIGSDQSGALGNLGLATCLFKIPGSEKPIETMSEVEVWHLPYRS